MTAIEVNGLVVLVEHANVDVRDDVRVKARAQPRVITEGNHAVWRHRYLNRLDDARVRPVICRNIACREVTMDTDTGRTQQVDSFVAGQGPRRAC